MGGPPRLAKAWRRDIRSTGGSNADRSYEHAGLPAQMDASQGYRH
jgi:hypothetical protein